MAMAKFFPKVSPRQTLETGLIVTLGCLIGSQLPSLAWMKDALIGAALVNTVLSLVIPRLYYPLAVVWFGLGSALGRVTSGVLLTLLFVLLVVPVAALKRLFGRDTLRLRAFKKRGDSVFVVRNHVYRDSDLQHPF